VVAICGRGSSYELWRAQFASCSPQLRCAASFLQGLEDITYMQPPINSDFSRLARRLTNTR
jgi:hypothetical protein